MTLPPYSKQALTHAEQVDQLRDRGMEIGDRQQAEFYLRHLNYYRLSAYWLPFEADHATHQFQPGTTFERVLELYVFDRELRLLVLDALERMEVSVRSHWAYQLGHAYGSHAHLDLALAHDGGLWLDNLYSLKKEVSRSQEVFIKHFKAKYSDPLPPVWAVCEVMTLGLLSRWYANLQPMAVRTAIASAYGLDQKVFESWLHHLSLVRNVCAHHSRLWNREFTVIPMLPQKPVPLSVQFQQGSRKVYNALVMLLHFMGRIAPHHHWRKRIVDLIAHHHIDLTEMGAPQDWASQPQWAGDPS